ncbi:MAG: hypothetical protein GF350_08990 [Chitinivibrionales bacterium]|nr:hypothetical protein [Chitinivibrionales bacterium]
MKPNVKRVSSYARPAQEKSNCLSVTVDIHDALDIAVDDYTGNGKPEIIVGNVIYSNTGEILFDATQGPGISSLQYTFDIDLDGLADSIAWIADSSDTFTVAYSGYDTSLLYVCPFNRWQGSQEQTTVGVLAQVREGLYRCSDISVSFPRYSAFAGDTSELTIRIANAGDGLLGPGVMVSIYKINADSTIIPVIETVTPAELASGGWLDISVNTLIAPVPGTGVRFVVDTKNRYFECNEKNNVIDWWFE